MKLRTKTLCLFLTLAIILTTVVACSSEEKIPTIRVVLDRTPITAISGLYVALENGFFEREGLNVELIQPPENGTLAFLGEESAEFGITSQEELGLVLAAEKPLPLTALAALTQNNSYGILSLKENGIFDPKDLSGKRLASWKTPVAEEMIRRVIEKDGGKFEEVDIVFDEATNTISDTISALKTKVDAAWVYWGWEGIATQFEGLEWNYIAFAECDEVFSFYSPILVANNNWLEKNPDIAKAFMNAVTDGYIFAEGFPAQASDILLKYAPGVSADMIMESQFYFSELYRYGVGRWGYIDSARWAQLYDWMYEKGIIDRPIGDKGFTNEYLHK